MSVPDPPVPDQPLDRVLNAWPDMALGPDWAETVLRALDLERLIRRMDGPPRSRATAEAEEAERIVRAYADAMAGVVPDQPAWDRVTKAIKAADDSGLSEVAQAARRAVARRRVRFITASLSCAAAFVVLTRFWLEGSRSVGLSLLLGIVALALLVGASLTLSRAGDLVVERRAVVVDYVWLLPSAVVLGVVIAGLLGRDEQTGDGPLWGVLAVVVAAMATTALIESLWLRGARPRTAPPDDSLAIPLGSAPIGRGGSPGPEAALLGALYRFTTALATRERRASYRWFAAFASLAFVGAVGAGVAGLSALGAQQSTQQGAQSDAPTPSPTPTPTPAQTQTGTEQSPSSSPLTLLAVIALIGAGATALSTGLNPGFEWRSAADRARACDALGREVLTMYRLDLPEYTEQRNVREAVQHVLDRLDKILVAPEGASFWSMVNTGVPARVQSEGGKPPADTGSDASQGGGGGSGTERSRFM